jgi:hypothetical protein
VLQPHTFKNMKINNYNDSYKMVKIDGGFKGIYTCSLTHQRMFDRGNCSSFENEMLSVHGRRDVCKKLHSLVKQGDIPQEDEGCILAEISLRSLANNARLTSKHNGGTIISMDGAYKLSLVTAEEEMYTNHGFRSHWPVRLANYNNPSSRRNVGPSFLYGFELNQE